MDKINDIEERKWYIKEIVQKGWSSNMLKMQIDGKVYERQALAEKTTNFDLTLPSVQSDLAIQTMKDPYLFDFISIKGKVKELEIENAMINKIKDVLIELGKGFAFVGSEYKLEVGGKEYFIDLLFYHLKLKCYIVVELKAREFEPTDAGQLNFYLSAVDDLVKDKDDNATIGLLLCKGKDNFTAEYALKVIQSSCIKPYIKTIYLYGSCARGEEKYSSDVDLFLELSESFLSRPELKKYLYLLKSEVSSDELDDAETDLKIVVGDEWKKNKMLYYANVRKEGIQIWP